MNWPNRSLFQLGALLDRNRSGRQRHSRKRNQTSRTIGPRLIVESLEDRRMLATVDIIAADGQATDNSPHDGTFDVVETESTLINTKTSGAAAEQRGIFEFDLTSILGSTIQSATFSFFVTAAFNRPVTIDFYGYAADGSITVTDAIDGTYVASADFVELADLNKGHSVDVTSFLQGLITSSETFAGFTLRSDSFNGGITMRSSDAAGTRPTLNVTFDPGGDPISDLIVDVQVVLQDSGELTAKDAAKLLKRLNKAQDNLEDGKPDKAIKELKKSIKDLNKQIKKNKLSDDVGQDLIKLVESAIDQL